MTISLTSQASFEDAVQTQLDSDDPSVKANMAIVANEIASSGNYQAALLDQTASTLNDAETALSNTLTGAETSLATATTAVDDAKTALQAETTNLQIIPGIEKRVARFPEITRPASLWDGISIPQRLYGSSIGGVPATKWKLTGTRDCKYYIYDNGPTSVTIYLNDKQTGSGNLAVDFDAAFNTILGFSDGCTVLAHCVIENNKILILCQTHSTEADTNRGLQRIHAFEFDYDTLDITYKYEVPVSNGKFDFYRFQYSVISMHHRDDIDNRFFIEYDSANGVFHWYTSGGFYIQFDAATGAVNHALHEKLNSGEPTALLSCIGYVTKDRTLTCEISHSDEGFYFIEIHRGGEIRSIAIPQTDVLGVFPFKYGITHHFNILPNDILFVNGSIYTGQETGLIDRASFDTFIKAVADEIGMPAGATPESGWYSDTPPYPAIVDGMTDKKPITGMQGSDYYFRYYNPQGRDSLNVFGGPVNAAPPTGKLYAQFYVNSGSAQIVDSNDRINIGLLNPDTDISDTMDPLDTGDFDWRLYVVASATYSRGGVTILNEGNNYTGAYRFTLVFDLATRNLEYYLNGTLKQTYTVPGTHIPVLFTQGGGNAYVDAYVQNRMTYNYGGYVDTPEYRKSMWYALPDLPA